MTKLKLFIASRIILAALVTTSLISCNQKAVSNDERAGEPETVAKMVTVAAIQCYSEMGKVEDNTTFLTTLIRKAAKKKAGIIVLPEAAVTGYMNPAEDITWTSSAKPAEGEISLKEFAEPIPGKSTKHFCSLARELGVYVTIPLIERDKDLFYNSVVLAAPNGTIIAHHRKQAMWLPGDSGWCTPGKREAQVVDTPYGRLGLMICYDWNVMPEKLEAKNVDIVLYSVGWFGPNTKDWYTYSFPKRVVIPNAFHVIASNWGGSKTSGEWEGQGYSCIIRKDGNVLNMARNRGASIVYAELPVNTDLTERK